MAVCGCVPHQILPVFFFSLGLVPGLERRRGLQTGQEWSPPPSAMPWEVTVVRQRRSGERRLWASGWAALALAAAAAAVVLVRQSVPRPGSHTPFHKRAPPRAGG